MFMLKRLLTAFIIFIIVHFSYSSAYCAWPSASQWIAVYKNYLYLQDNNSDTNGSRNVVSDATHPAAFFYNDGQYIYFRLRLDQSPAGSGGQGYLLAFGWGLVLDTNNNPNDYEWMIMVDGISKDENIALWSNITQGIMGSASDQPEQMVTSVPVFGNYQIVQADTSINGDTDYFLDWRFPYASFKSYTGLNDQNPLRMFFGSSPSANVLKENGGDFVGGSDLVSGFSDYITAGGVQLGPIPGTTGVVGFTDGIAGSGQVTSINAGDPVYIKVTDMDMNKDDAKIDTISVNITTSANDAETVILFETGVKTGIFTGTINSKIISPPTQNNGLADVKNGDTITAIYIDARDSVSNVNQQRTANAGIVLIQLPALKLTKTTNKTEALPGDEIIYTVKYENIGNADGYSVEIADAIPDFAAYVPSSLKMGGVGSVYTTAVSKTDAAGDDDAEFSNNTVIFRIPYVKKNDNTVNSGLDEGYVYYKVTIQ